jgi:peptidoglycan/LPS O-acetylase OafA/YrhL
VLARARWALAGAVSYPFYLLHQHIGFMLFNRLYPAINPHVLFWGTIAVVLGAAFAVHLLVERRLSQPLRIAVNHVADRVWR